MQIKDLLPAMHWPWEDKPEDGAASKDADKHPLVSLQRDMNKVFESFWRNLDAPGGAFAGEGAPRSDVVETEKTIEISIELPGLAQEDIDVSVSDDALTIKGEKKLERKEEKTGYYLSERRYGSIYRSLPLPAGVDSDKAEAGFKNGVLTVTLPKTAEAREKTKKISISAG